MFAIARCSVRCVPLKLRNCRKRAGRRICEAARIIGLTEDRVIAYEPGILCCVEHRAIHRMDHAPGVENLRKFHICARSDRLVEQRKQGVTMNKSQTVVLSEGHLALSLDCSDGLL